MSLKIRLSRGGSKKRPYYRIVLADTRSPRDGRYIERLGTYNPLLSKDDKQRFVFDKERIEHWLKNGAKPTDRIIKFLAAEKIMEDIKRDNPIKAKPKIKAQEKTEAAEENKEEAPAADAAPEEKKEEAPAADAAPEDKDNKAP